MHVRFLHPTAQGTQNDMTINKAQRQTLKMVDIFLPKPVFTHG
jgi:hypothetical protein